MSTPNKKPRIKYNVRSPLSLKEQESKSEAVAVAAQRLEDWQRVKGKAHVS